MFAPWLFWLRFSRNLDDDSSERIPPSSPVSRSSRATVMFGWSCIIAGIGSTGVSGARMDIASSNPARLDTGRVRSGKRFSRLVPTLRAPRAREGRAAPVTPPITASRPSEPSVMSFRSGSPSKRLLTAVVPAPPTAPPMAPVTALPMIPGASVGTAAESAAPATAGTAILPTIATSGSDISHADGGCSFA